MRTRHDYAREKLGVAMYSLAVSARPIQERLWGAWMSFHVLQPDDFADREAFEITDRALFERIVAALTARQATGGEGTVRATLAEMTDDEAVAVARDNRRPALPAPLGRLSWAVVATGVTT